MATATGVSIPPARERASRPLLDRMLARTPRLIAAALPLLARLPPSSQLRRRALQAWFSRVFAAINRRDPWFVSIGYEPDCELYITAGFRSLGLAECYRGHDGWREMIDAVREFLPDVRWTPELLIDLGDHWILRAGMSGSGRASGVRTDQTWGSVFHLSARGRIARQDIHWTWPEALAAVGLSEERTLRQA